MKRKKGKKGKKTKERKRIGIIGDGSLCRRYSSDVMVGTYRCEVWEIDDVDGPQVLIYGGDVVLPLSYIILAHSSIPLNVDIPV